MPWVVYAAYENRMIGSCSSIFVHLINSVRLCLETSISFQIIDFNYKIINEEFENKL